METARISIKILLCYNEIGVVSQISSTGGGPNGQEKFITQCAMKQECAVMRVETPFGKAVAVPMEASTYRCAGSFTTAMTGRDI